MPKRRAQQTALFVEEQRARPVSPQARAMCSRGKKQAPAPKPWEAVLLVVDTAKVSGWAICVRGQVVAHGEHNTEQRPDLTANVIAQAVGRGELHALPVILVLEAPYGGKTFIVLALGVAKGRWIDAWKRAKQAATRRVTVQPSQWRGPVLGSWAAKAKRDDVRATELSVARGIVGCESLGADEAAAICISHWATYAPAVGKALGERARKKSMAAWQRREVAT